MNETSQYIDLKVKSRYTISIEDRTSYVTGHGCGQPHGEVIVRVEYDVLGDPICYSVTFRWLFEEDGIGSVGVDNILIIEDQVTKPDYSLHYSKLLDLLVKQTYQEVVDFSKMAVIEYPEALDCIEKYILRKSKVKKEKLQEKRCAVV